MGLKEVAEKASNLGTIGGAISGGINLVKSLFGNNEKKQREAEERNDARQLKQQEALQKLGIAGNKELADYEQMLKMKMWNDTNYSAQMKQAEMAGLSKVAVLGGGGTGTQGASVGNVAGGTADGASATQGVNQQSEIMNAQIANMNADTALKTAQAVKTGGVDTTAVKTGIDATKAGIEATVEGTKNMRVKTAGEELSNILKGIEAEIAEATKGNVITLSEYQVEKASAETAILINEKGISDATKNERINAIALQNASMIENIIKTQTDVKYTKEQTEAIKTQLKALMINAWASSKNAETNRMTLEQDWKKGIGGVLNGILGGDDVKWNVWDGIKGVVKTVTPRWSWKYIDKFTGGADKGK